MRSQFSEPIRYDRLISGLAVLLVGVLSFLEQQGRISQSQLLDLWPLVLIAVGLCYLLDRGRRKARASGLFLFLAGVLLLVGNFLPPSHTMEIWLGWLGFRISWPLLLVVIGIYIAGRDVVTGRPAQEKQR